MITKHWDNIARRYVEHDTTPMETFGELRYAFDDSALGMAKAAAAAHNDNLTHAMPDRMLAAIRDLPGFVYLGSPYSLYRGGHDEAARVVASYAAAMMASGLRVYSPIAHGHFVTAHGKLPLSWGFWKDQCQPMIDAASSLVVLTMDGWGESVGLTYEIEEFARAGKPVVYLAPVAAMGRAAA